ncbi:MAG: FHA domain-containing protein [Gemmatimonadales bacterium]
MLAVLDESGEVRSRHPLGDGDTTVGREGATIEFSEDVFMSPLHAKFTVEDGKLSVRDLGSRNGTWRFISEPHRLSDGERIFVGSQLIEFRRLGYPGPTPPERDATRRLGSLVPSADIARLTQLRSDGSGRDLLHLSPGRRVVIGRENGDWIFPYDPSMSGRHAEVRSEDADFVVVDLNSRNGVAVSVRGSMELAEGARILIGDKLLRVEKP